MEFRKKAKKVFEKIDDKTDIKRTGKFVSGKIRQAVQNLPAETDTLGFIMKGQRRRSREDKFMDDKISRNQRAVAQKMQSEGSRITNLLVGDNSELQINAELL